MPKIILFNGPPRSGKDTATRLAMEHLGKRAVHYRFAGPLKDAAHSLFGMHGVGQEHFDAIKNQESPLFFGMTPRNAYIWLSEEVAKPKFGKDFFAKVAANAISNFSNEIVIVSDCGFIEEADALIEKFGGKNVMVVYLHRKETSFDGDSRSYICPPCRQHTINNNGSVDDFRESIVKMLTEFLHAI